MNAPENLFHHTPAKSKAPSLREQCKVTAPLPMRFRVWAENSDLDFDSGTHLRRFDSAVMNSAITHEVGDLVLVRLVGGETVLRRLADSEDGPELVSCNNPSIPFDEGCEVLAVCEYVCHHRNPRESLIRDYEAAGRPVPDCVHQVDQATQASRSSHSRAN